jgi:hypothetical protein
MYVNPHDALWGKLAHLIANDARFNTSLTSIYAQQESVVRKWLGHEISIEDQQVRLAQLASKLEDALLYCLKEKIRRINLDE